MNDRDELVAETFLKSEIHEQWVRTYEAGENDPFYQAAFDKIFDRVPMSQTATVLDAGCGDGSKSVRLAKRGVTVQAIDFSPIALKMAYAKINESGFSKNIFLTRANLCELSFQDECFHHVLCWGVLMHIPNEEAAIGELARVLKPGGYLIIKEANAKALENRLALFLKKLISSRRNQVELTDKGTEYWKDTENGILLARKSNIRWLVNFCEDKGLTLDYRLSAELTEIYAKLGWKFFRNLIYTVNRVWLRVEGNPDLAVCNILFFRKNDPNMLIAL